MYKRQTLNEWQHLAVTRSGGTVYGYRNGVYFGSVSSTLNLDNTKYALFNRYSDNFNFGNQGYIQDARVTKGLARYSGTSNFTPPTESLKG